MVGSGDCSGDGALGSRLLFVFERYHCVEFGNDHRRCDYVDSANLHKHDRNYGERRRFRSCPR
jgi:hypothetical protein